MLELEQVLFTQDPNKIVVTKTKLNKSNCNSLAIKGIPEDNTLFDRCNAPIGPLRRKVHPKKPDRDGAGDVTVAAQNIWCGSGSVKLFPNEENPFHLTVYG